jgi:hypothetical protein
MDRGAVTAEEMLRGAVLALAFTSLGEVAVIVS